jgi:hypothetical protein
MSIMSDSNDVDSFFPGNNVAPSATDGAGILLGSSAAAAALVPIKDDALS